MMNAKVLLFVLFIFVSNYVDGDSIRQSNETGAAASTNADEMDLEAYRVRLLNQTQRVEKAVKNFIKGTLKNLLPSLMRYNNEDTSISTKCMGAFMKYISGLTNVKVWALKMLDSTSKPPAGILEGTFSDFGAFDQCIAIQLPTRKGNIEFTGKYCAIELKPRLPPTPNNFSFAKQEHAGPLDTIGKELYIAGTSFNYLKFHMGVCVPSLCTLEDMQGLAKSIGDRIDMDLKIPQCYVKEKVVLKAIHIVVICIVCLLFLVCVAGSVVEYKTMDIPSSERKLSRSQQILLCFSFISNYRRLISSSKGSEDLKALHGLRALSMAWVILGHTYVWTNFQLLRRPEQAVVWFNRIDFGSILNAWLSVEPFFFLSGLLTCYAVLKIMPKTKGRINVPVYILRRYVRLTPSLLLVMSFALFLPVISSGPFWYDRMDSELKPCQKYWWRSILYISNWTGMKNICLHTTWYLSADFQLHVISVVTLYVLYRYPKLGLSLIAAFVAACSVAVGTLTYIWNLPPLILVSSGNDRQIMDTVDVVHLNTFTHAGPYYVGIVTAYLVLKYKDIKITKQAIACFWLLSALVSLSSLYGAHRWNIGEPHGPLLTAIYAALHRTTFTVGIAWVAFACVTGYGGLVNLFLSSSILAPISRLTYLIYLMHPLVIWTRISSMRERRFFSHYDMLYDYITNLVFSILFSVPPYLLLEAPLSNLDRMIFSKPVRPAEANLGPSYLNGIHASIQENKVQYLGPFIKSEVGLTAVPTELMSVKHVGNGCNNLAFSDELNKTKDGSNALHINSSSSFDFCKETLTQLKSEGSRL